MAKWQPKDTAPKGGPSILICRFVWDKPEISVAHWSDGWGEGPGWHLPDTQCGGYWKIDDEFWVWMPLPAAPKERA